MPIKVYDLAKELKMTNSEMVRLLADMGHKGQAPSNDLEDAVAAAVRQRVGGTNGTGQTPDAPAADGADKTGSGGGGGVSDAIEIPANITIKDLADKLGVAGSEIQKVLMSMGVLAALNQRLAPDAVLRIAQKLGKTVRTASGGGPGSGSGGGGGSAPQRTAAGAAAPSKPATAPASGGPAARPLTGGSRAVAVAAKHKSPHGLAPRPPVITVMGHVDHGKTTLLDALRKTSVAAGESGGITQHIGAYQVETDGKRMTFLDTPGHAAFSAMRARGAQVTDIVVIVVAADDSIMPQTEEAIQHAREAGVPMIVAVNKIDLPDANPDRVLTDLTRYEIVPEAYGGDVPTVNISAKNGDGLNDLLENILLVSEVVVDPKADPHGKAQGTVIEAKIDKGRGAVVTVLVQQGTLRMGDVVVAGEHSGKIRTMNDDRGGKVNKAGPSTPVEIVGFGAVPSAGDRLEVVKDEKEARAVAARREQRAREERLDTRNLVTLEDLYKRMREGEAKELNLVIKGDVQGSVEAVRDSLEKLGTEEVRVRVLSAGVGPISENDILLAAADKDADTSNSLVVGFNVGPASGVEKKAEQEHVQIRTFTIIYDLIDAVKEAMVGLLEPIYEEVSLGRAEVRQLFKLPGGRQIAGCYVQDGLVRRNARARLLRGGNVIHTGDIDTLKRFKDDAREVQTGYECGMTLRDSNDIQVGDTIECFEMRQIPREL